MSPRLLILAVLPLIHACDEAVSDTPTSGAFRPTFAGFATPPPNAVVYWQKEGGLVHLTLRFSVGESSGSDFAITNLPETIWGAGSVHLLPSGVDAGANIPLMTAYVSNVISFGAGTTHHTGGGWSSAGFKGLGTPGYSLTYAVD